MQLGPGATIASTELAPLVYRLGDFLDDGAFGTVFQAARNDGGEPVTIHAAQTDRQSKRPRHVLLREAFQPAPVVLVPSRNGCSLPLF